MLRNLTIYSLRLMISLFVIFIFSCESPDSSPLETRSDEVLQLISKPNSKIKDLEALLGEGNASIAELVSGAEGPQNTELLDDAGLPIVSSSNNNSVSRSTEEVISENTEAEKALQSLEVSALEHQKNIEELRKINEHKDKTIASLSTINDELLAEIRRIKGDASNDFRKFTTATSSRKGTNTDLHSEIKNLKNSLMLKSNEIKDLRVRNDSLEVRISSLEKTPVSKVILAEPNKYSNLSQIPSVSMPSLSFPCTLNFDAVVTSYNGKSKEAFYTEFFIMRDNLNELLNKGGVSLLNFSGVESYSELWAQARKNSFLYPDLQKKIRNCLLLEIENGNGQRVRTDLNGAATVSKLTPGEYYIIGTAALGKVGVTWNVPINVENGLNKVSLTLANASWSE